MDDDDDDFYYCYYYYYYWCAKENEINVDHSWFKTGKISLLCCIKKIK